CAALQRLAPAGAAVPVRALAARSVHRSASFWQRPASGRGSVSAYALSAASSASRR
ncbi:MAG: hypothetical protein AVDCRST_MAG19-4499, partial [uncultured Thermomicrobiales bacterium]